MTESEQGTARRGIGGAARSAAATVQRSASGRAETSNGSNGRLSGDPARQQGGPSSGGQSSGRSSASSAQRSSSPRKPRRARLRLTQVDAWSVMKTAFLLSIALGIVAVVAVGIVWSVLGAAGVWDSLNSTIQTVMGNDFRIQDYIGTGRMLGFTMLVSVVDVVLLTAIATLVAFLYNLAATLLGGVELTLTEDG